MREKYFLFRMNQYIVVRTRIRVDGKTKYNNDTNQLEKKEKIGLINMT